MEYVTNIKISQTVIVVDAQPCYVRSAIASVAATVQQVDCIRSRLGIRIRRKEIQTLSKSLLYLGLKPVVETIARRNCVTIIPSEIRERESALRRRECTATWSSIKTRRICELKPGRQNLCWVVRSWEHFQMAPQRSHVSSLDRDRGCQLILQSEVSAHGIRRLVIELDSTQA